MWRWSKFNNFSPSSINIHIDSALISLSRDNWINTHKAHLGRKHIKTFYYQNAISRPWAATSRQISRQLMSIKKLPFNCKHQECSFMMSLWATLSIKVFKEENIYRFIHARIGNCWSTGLTQTAIAYNQFGF